MNIYTLIKFLLISFFCFYSSKIHAINFIDYDHQIKGSHSYTDAKMIDGELWISTGRGLIVNSGGVSRHILLNPPYSDEIYTINEAREGKLWLGTNKGLYLFDIEKERVLTKARFKNGEIFENSVINALNDNAERLVIGTARNGIYYVNNRTFEIELNHNEGVETDNVYVFNLIKAEGRVFATILPAFVRTSSQMVELIEAKGNVIEVPGSSSLISNIDIDNEHIWLFSNDSIKKMTKNMTLLEEFLIPYSEYKNETMFRKFLKLSEGHYLLLMHNNGVIEFNNGNYKQYKLKGESQVMRAMIQDDYGSIYVLSRLNIYVSYKELDKIDFHKIEKYRVDNIKQPGDHYYNFEIINSELFITALPNRSFHMPRSKMQDRVWLFSEYLPAIEKKWEFKRGIKSYSGTNYMLTSKSVYLYQNNQLKKIFSKPKAGQFYDIWSGKDGCIWFHNIMDVYYFCENQEQSLEVKRFKYDFDGKIEDVKTTDSKLLITTRKNIYMFDLPNLQISKVLDVNNKVFNINESFIKNNKYLLLDSSGVLELDIGSGEVSHILLDSEPFTGQFLDENN